MPFRFSIMSLVSNGRVQVYEPQILDLIRHLINKGFTVGSQKEFQKKQASEFWGADDPSGFDYKLYQIAIEYVAKASVLASARPLQPSQLVDAVEGVLAKRDKDGHTAIEAVAREQVRDPNKIAQRRIYLTPTLKLIGPAEIEQSNTILRNLKYNIEYLTRVKIISEDYTEEWFNKENQVQLLDSFVKRYIRNIWFCGVHMKFLNYSASQIKSKSWWAYVDNHGFGEKTEAEQERAPSDSSSDIEENINHLNRLSKNRDEFLTFIGEFKQSDKPLKKLARQGQGMSTTTHIQDFTDDEFVEIRDVERHGLAFSDGSGFISPEVMLKIAHQFDFAQVSAIQMRFAGYKGVLVQHQGLGKVQENGKKVHMAFRDSMKKFQGKLNELGVIRCSTWSPAYLNQQVILLLDNLGVPPRVFIDMNFKAI